ncbi:hypothetical protein ACHQM5_008579 [Ranunculus cassubicifolius]
MASITLSSVSNTNHLREASFSSYVKGSEEIFGSKRFESTQKPSPDITTNQELMYQASLGRKKTGYGEIGVFGAEKYFNGAMDKEEATHANKPKVKRSGTPSTTSEASWNSRSALLPVMQSRQEKGNGKGFFAQLGCNCYCSNNKSVDVDEKLADTKSCISSKGEIYGKVAAKLPIEIKHIDPIGTTKLEEKNSDDCFTLPISGVMKLSMEEEYARKSLEVFGSPIMEKDDIASSLEKRLSILTWDANPKVENSPLIDIVSSVPDDGNDSDSSSDLFEIKSLSSNGHPFFRRQASDSMSGCMSPSYEPSEASIDWSVVTASAANFSVATDFDEPGRPAKNTTTNTKTEMNKDGAKRRPTLLSGCRNHKAVNVVGGVHKLPEKKPEMRGNQKTNPYATRSRFQAESKVTDLEFARAQRALSMH